jgi:CelD/BcsL family acetyltransferase involved in cellulose biosynthesis
MVIEAIETEPALVALRDEWTALLGRAAGPELALTWEWMHTWWSVFGDDSRQLLVLALREDGRLVGLAPLQVRTVRPRPWLPRTRRVEFLATGEPEADAICSDHLGVLAERGRERAVARRLAEHLAGDRAGAWDELDLAAMDGDAPATAALADALRAAGLAPVRRHLDVCPYLPLPAAWDGLEAALDARTRGELRRGARRLAERGRPEFSRVTAPAELGGGFDILVELHRRRRAGRGTAGAFDSAAFTAFHRRLLPLALRAGWLELRVLALDGMPVVARYNLRFAGRVHYYQGGMDTAAAPGVSLGLLMDAHCIREAVADRLREFDFLRGAEPYKRRWTSATRELVALRVESGRPRSVALARQAGRLLRRWTGRADPAAVEVPA